MTCSRCFCPRESAKHSWCRACSNAYMRARRRGDVRRRLKACAVVGCSRQVRFADMCSLHRQRLRRTGSVTLRPRTLHAKRYRLVVRRGHALAHASTGRVYVHRAVLFDNLGWGNFACFWCGTTVRWSTSHPQPTDALITDHVDHDRHNNDVTNLVPSCGRCNSARSRWRTMPPLTPMYSAGAVAA